MEALTRSTTNIITLSRIVVSKSHSWGVRSLSLLPISLNPKAIKWVASSHLSSSEAEVSKFFGTADTEIQTIQPSKTVRVKFQLQKECLFGEHFLLVGDDPMIGFWNPSNAIPMNWSDGHVWTVELDVPIERSMQFKYILKRSTGDILWQPGPNRVFGTWETKKTITVAEDWENPEFQEITDDSSEVMCNVSEEFMSLDNIAHLGDETIDDRNKEIFAAEKMSVSEEGSLKLNHIEDSVGIWEGVNENSRTSVEDKEGVFGYKECAVLVPGLTEL